MNNPYLSLSLLEALGQFDSPTISNAIEYFKVRDPVSGYATLDLRCQFPERKPMVGYAVTCTADTSTPGDTRPNGLDKVWAAVEAAPKPAVLVIQHLGHDRLRSCFVGDMFCTALQKYGAVGVVTDGGIRDRTGIQRKTRDFQVFCAGLVVSHGYTVFLDFNVTVSICGLTIVPGDILHGDESGLLTIPGEIAESVLGQAREVQAAERDYFDFLQTEAFNFDELRRRMGGH